MKRSILPVECEFERPCLLYVKSGSAKCSHKSKQKRYLSPPLVKFQKKRVYICLKIRTRSVYPSLFYIYGLLFFDSSLCCCCCILQIVYHQLAIYKTFSNKELVLKGCYTCEFAHYCLLLPPPFRFRNMISRNNSFITSINSS